MRAFVLAAAFVAPVLIGAAPADDAPAATTLISDKLVDFSTQAGTTPFFAGKVEARIRKEDATGDYIYSWRVTNAPRSSGPVVRLQVYGFPVVTEDYVAGCESDGTVGILPAALAIAMQGGGSAGKVYTITLGYAGVAPGQSSEFINMRVKDGVAISASKSSE